MTRGMQVFRYSFIWLVFCCLQQLISLLYTENIKLHVFIFLDLNFAMEGVVWRSHQSKQERFGIFQLLIWFYDIHQPHLQQQQAAVPGQMHIRPRYATCPVPNSR